MKKPLDIRILEHLETLPAEKFPLNELDLPGGQVPSTELLAEVFRMEEAGLIKAATARNSQGQPAMAVITDKTVHGRGYLEQWLSQAREKDPLLKGARWTRDMLLLGVGMVAGGILTKFGESLFELLKRQIHLQ